MYPILPGEKSTYRFSIAGEYGFSWYHSHVWRYYSDGVKGPLLIHSSPSRKRPFKKLATSTKELKALLQAERSAENVLLSDWFHELSDTTYERYLETGAFPFCVDSLLTNGMGRINCLPESVLNAGLGLGIRDDAS